MFSKSVKLFDIFGFQIKVDPSWLLIAALIVWSLSSGYFPAQVPGLGRFDYLGISIISMLGLFVSLILHELAHSLVARQFGLNVGGITLFLFGGVAELDHEPVDAKSEFWIALAGPVMSLALAGLGWSIMHLSGAETSSQTFMAVIGYLSLINLVLAVFNLVPAFPLDGGRILRAIIWHYSGDLMKATRIASRSGTFFAYFLIGAGMFSLFQGFGLGSLWQILIGYFILAASKSSYEQMVIKQALGGMTVADLMSKDPVTADVNCDLSDVIDNIMLKQNISFIPVTDGDHLLGYVDVGLIQKIERENWSTVHLSDIFVSLDKTNSTDADVSLEDLFTRMARTGQRKYMIQKDGQLIGVIALSDMLRYLAIKQGVGIDQASADPLAKSFRQREVKSGDQSL